MRGTMDTIDRWILRKLFEKKFPKTFKNLLNKLKKHLFV